MHQGFRRRLTRQFLNCFNFAAQRLIFFSLTLSAVCALIPLMPLTSQAAASRLTIPGGGFLNLDAKNFTRDFDRGTVELSGHVQLIYNQQYMSCDHAIVNEKTHEIQADGNLVISSPQAYVEGDSALLNYQTNTGTIINGYVKSGQVIFEGTIVRKTGPDTYEAEHSFYTACTTCPTAWTFAGSRMSAQLGGYAFIKYPWLEIGGIRLLWLPYLVLPLKSERQSGLLIPNFEYGGSDGVVLGLRGFWAIDRSQDATFTVKDYSRRGIKEITNYRYMLSPTSAGEGTFGIIHDQIFSSESIFANQPVGNQGTRWFLNYDHNYDLPYNINQKTSLNLASDLWYSRDFPSEQTGRGDPALENRFSLSRNTEHIHTSLDAEYYINMIKENPVAGNQDAVHRWPELRFSSVQQSVLGSNFLFNFNADYVNFARDGYGYDDVNIDANGNKTINTNRTGPGGGIFNPSTDIVRTGQRLDLKPEISYPLRAGKYLDILPTLQGRFTQYAFNVSTSPLDPTPYDTTPYRDYVRGVLSVRTKFYSLYGQNNQQSGVSAGIPVATSAPLLVPGQTTSWTDTESLDRNGSSDSNRNLSALPKIPDIYRHEIEPELTASYVPYIQQPSDHPFFRQGAQIPVFLDDQPITNATFDSSTDALQFDYNDRLTNRTLLEGAITNRLIRKRWLSGTPSYQQIASLKVGQSYDLDEAKRQQAPVLPYSDIFANFDLHLDNLDANSAVRYFPYHAVANTTSYVRLKNNKATNFFQLSYSQATNILVTTGPETSGLNETIGLALGFASKYIDLTGSINYGLSVPTPGIWDLTTWAVDMNFKPPGNCWGIKLHYEETLGGQPAVKADFDFKFGGETG